MEATLDKFGRIVIPKRIRNNLGLDKGTVFKIEEGQEEIVLRPIKDEPCVVVRKGVLVFSGTATGDIVEASRGSRKRRIDKVGKWKAK